MAVRDFPADVLKMPVYDPGDPEMVAKAQEASGYRSNEEAEFVRRLLLTYEGRAFFSMAMGVSGLDSSSFRGEDTHTTAFLEGQKEVGRWARNFIFTVAPEQYNLVKLEAIQREQQYAKQAGFDTEND